MSADQLSNYTLVFLCVCLTELIRCPPFAQRSNESIIVPDVRAPNRIIIYFFLADRLRFLFDTGNGYATRAPCVVMSRQLILNCSQRQKVFSPTFCTSFNAFWRSLFLTFGRFIRRSMVRTDGANGFVQCSIRHGLVRPLRLI